MKVDLGKLRHNPEAPLLAIDLLMVLLVIFNLAWIVFNALFASRVFQAGIAWLSPEFHAWYRDDIRPNFVDIDMVFVSIYVAELLLRWGIAIARHTYHRWFFYPFVHWYDVLGCIPIGSFRWLRILRVVALLWRLQQQGIIDIRDSWLVRTLRKYLDIVTEEIADRVVLNVLDGVHGELERGNPVVHRIGREVLAPRRDELLDWLAGRLQHTTDATWRANSKVLDAYLNRVIAESLDASDEIRRLGHLPVVGPALSDALDAAVSDIARSIVDHVARDLSAPANHARLRDALGTALDAMLADDERVNRLVREALLESLDIIKQQVGVQQWKLREAEGYYD